RRQGSQRRSRAHLQRARRREGRGQGPHVHGDRRPARRSRRAAVRGADEHARRRAERARVAPLCPPGREDLMSSLKKQKRIARPEGQLRQSQLITTFGPGSMVDLVDRAVVIGGLEHWGYGKGNDGEALDDPRLRRALIPRLKALHPDLDLAKSHYFRKPPEGDVRDPFPSVGVRALE